MNTRMRDDEIEAAFDAELAQCAQAWQAHVAQLESSDALANKATLARLALLAHTVKGAASVVAAEEIHRDAADLERLLEQCEATAVVAHHRARLTATPDAWLALRAGSTRGGQAVAPAEPSLSETGASALVGAKVLVVDDSPATALHLSVVVEALGGEVQVAQGGAEGLALLAQWLPDVIVCDVMMPDMDGAQFHRALARDARLRTLPLVFCSALDASDARRLVGADSAEYLAKPISTAGLAEGLQRALRKSQAPKEK